MGRFRIRPSTLKLIMHILDIHTHQYSEHTNQSILNSDLSHFSPQQGYFYSVGIHPWNVTNITTTILNELKEICQHPQVLAIGETGLDKIKTSNWDEQVESFKLHIQISETLHKPLIIHCVKSTAEIIKFKKMYQPHSAWIIHGFRGKKELAAQLIKQNIYFSFGEKHNKETLINTPIERLFIETDNSPKSILNIYQEIAQKRSISIEMLTNQVQQNICALFFKQ